MTSFWVSMPLAAMVPKAGTTEWLTRNNLKDFLPKFLPNFWKSVVSTT